MTRAALLPQIGWIDIPADEALELGLEQAGRCQWQIFRVEWLGCGFTFMARVRP
jgi:hypothetical protein